MNDQTEAPERRIVVGVDGSPHSKAALRWAITQARLIDAIVEAVGLAAPALAYSPTARHPSGMRATASPRSPRRSSPRRYDVAGQHDKAVEIRTRVVQGHPVQVLLEAATGAQLLVLGSRGHGTFAGLLLGSVSQHCVQHAPCPVLVVPQDTTPSQ